MENIELYKSQTYTAPDGQISLAGISIINSFIASQRLQDPDWLALDKKSNRRYLPVLPTAWEWVWVIERGELTGTFPRRVARYYHKMHAIRCPQTFLQELGNLARRHSSERVTYRFQFVDSFDWEAGDFGDSGSCYWGGRSGARLMLASNDALAVCFFDEQDRGIARAWFVPVDEKYIVFNGYGFPGDPTLTIARTISSFLGLSYKQIGLANYGSTTGTLYINSGIGYVLGQPDQIASINFYDFGWEDEHADSCHHCGQMLYDDEVYYGPGDLTFCESCYCDHCSSCDICGEVYWADEVRYVNGHDVCDWCYTREYSICNKCGEDVRNRNAIVIRGKSFCQSCRQPKPETSPG
ncbi:MAG: hypothetical protein JXB07_18970 [Anaerolineae bacterium]|nr:hypothetical protein [Anaerolineae bacterium]